jgi:hypothetical protein
MNSTPEKTASDTQASSVASTTAKRPWQAPEIEEVDFAETQASVAGAPSGDSNGYS